MLTADDSKAKTQTPTSRQAQETGWIQNHLKGAKACLQWGQHMIQKAFRHTVRDTGAEEGSRDIRVGRGHLDSSLCNNHTQNLVPELKRKQQKFNTNL